MGPKKDHSKDNISEDQLRVIIREELMQALLPINSSLQSINNQITTIKADITSINARQTETEAALTYQDKSLVHFETMFETLKNFTLDIATSLAMYIGDIDTHARKWSLIVHGIAGDVGEEEAVTRRKCIELGAKLGVSEPLTSAGIAACHRLAQSAGAGIILRFTDLSVRNEWLSQARTLKADDKISISPDMPPKLRLIKTAVLNHRKELSAENKRASKVKHLPTWPYVQLTVNGTTLDPLQSKLDVITSMLKIEHVPTLKLPTRDP